MSKSKHNAKVKNIIILFIIAILCLIGVYILNYIDKEYHTHADFKVYNNNSFMNFTADIYQSNEYKINHDDVHLHNNDGDVIHHHAKGITLNEFFDSINISLENPIVYVNGARNEQGLNNIFKDLDQILIIVNTDNYDINVLLQEITDKACIQSAICPERGLPNEGSCVSGEVCKPDMTQFN